MDGLGNSLDDVSADSSVESSDRVSLMEVRLQAQEDEITLLKSSLADALRRLHVHEQQIPLLRQHIIAVNPAAARTLNHSFCSDGFSRTRKLSTNSASDIPHRSSCSQVSHAGQDEDTEIPKVHLNASGNGLGLVTHDRATQTDCSLLSGKASLAQTRALQSLSLEDALLGEEAPEEVRGACEGARDWSAVVEEPIRPSCVGALIQDPASQQEVITSKNDSPEGQGKARMDAVQPSAWVAAAGSCPLGSAKNAASRSQPLSPVQEMDKHPPCVPPVSTPCSSGPVHMYGLPVAPPSAGGPACVMWEAPLTLTDPMPPLRPLDWHPAPVLEEWLSHSMRH